MKTLQKMGLLLGLAGLFFACQSANQVLSRSDKRIEIMNAIANDPSMSKEMMEILMEEKMGKMNRQQKEMMMKQQHMQLMKLMKENPEIMKKMMAEMMHKAESDTTMMAGMCKTMMESKKMMEMMQKMKVQDAKPKKEEEPKSHH